MNLHSSAVFAHRLFLWLGVATLAYAGGTAAYAVAYQRYESREFQRALVTATAREPEHQASSANVVKSFIAEEVYDLREGDVVGKLEVPRIGISVIVLQGIANDTLSVGAGHVPGTPLPGADGNVVIAAHRDTFFRKLEGIVARRHHPICKRTRSNAPVCGRLDGNCRSGRHSGYGVPGPSRTHAYNLLSVLFCWSCAETIHRARAPIN